MTATELTCSANDRREAIRKANEQGEDWNGIDYVECPEAENRLTIRVVFFCDLKTEDLTLIKGCIAIRSEAGEAIQAQGVSSHENEVVILLSDETAKQIKTSGVSYTVSIKSDCVNGSTAQRPLGRIDQRFTSATFRYFSQDRDLDVDPKKPQPSARATAENPIIDYTARDYQSFRQLILDRLAITMPEWRETHVPDIGIAIVEIMAYVADHFAYFQDAVATEAYLSTARNRVSVRRHARLIDYEVDEGSNARTMLQVQVSQDVDLDPANVYFITRPSEKPVFDEINLLPSQLETVPGSKYQVFEPVIEKTDGQSAFTVDEIRDPLSLLIKVRSLPILTNSDYRQIFSYLKEQLAEVIEQAFSSESLSPQMLNPSMAFSGAVVGSLVQVLNNIIRTPGLFRKIDRSSLSQQAQEMLECCDETSEWDQVNRIILDDLFPQELSTRKRKVPRISLYREHNEIEIYTWDQSECCLPAGATHVTLKDRWLKPGEPSGGAGGCVGVTAAMQNEADENVPDCEGSASILQRVQDRALRLRAGDLLLLEETVDPATGVSMNADATHRQIVRITKVTATVDYLHNLPVLEVWWHIEDQLRFPLCVSAVSSEPSCKLNVVAVARGNVVPVDHGETIWDEPIGQVIAKPVEINCDHDVIAEPRAVPIERFRPALENAGLAFRNTPAVDDSARDWQEPQRTKSHPAVQLLGIPTNPATNKPVFTPFELRRPTRCASCIATLDDRTSQRLQNAVDPGTGQLLVWLQSLAARGRTATVHKYGMLLCHQLLAQLAWRPQQDLLSSNDTDQHFVVEMDNYGKANLRFGQGLGKQPDPGLQFFATYRIGGGDVGNVGADAITRVVHRSGMNSAITRVTNPLAAKGGRTAESIDSIKINAPHAIRQVDRAIIAGDYVTIVREIFGHRVNGVRCMTKKCGAITVVLLTVDPKPDQDFDKLKAEIRQRLTPMQRVGHFLTINSPSYVSVDIRINVRAKPGWSQSNIRAEMRARFGSGTLPDGSLGFFHSDRLRFGDPIYASQLTAEAMKAPGVANARLDLKRGYSTEYTDVLSFHSLEIPVVDDPRHEAGKLTIDFAENLP